MSLIFSCGDIRLPAGRVLFVAAIGGPHISAYVVKERKESEQPGLLDFTVSTCLRSRGYEPLY